MLNLMKWYKQTIGDTRLIQAGCRVRMTVYCELNMPYVCQTVLLKQKMKQSIRDCMLNLQSSSFLAVVYATIAFP